MSLFSIYDAVGEAHSKLILAGEHAVVYGKPAIAIPFPLKMRVRFEVNPGEAVLESLIYSGCVDKLPNEMNGIKECIRMTFQKLQKPLKDLKITIDSEIPLGRGLGSSAAVSTAVVRAIYSFYNTRLTDEELFSLVGLSEAYAHGKPSGIDMIAVAKDLPIYFKKTERAEYFSIQKPLHIVVADSGIIGDTRKAVGNVKQAYESDKERISKIIDRIGDISHQVKNSMILGDIAALGKLLNENHEELRALGVSDSSLDNLVEEARKLGALGAKLTGGGLGGCIIALADSLEAANKLSKGLINAGAVKSWYFSTDGNVLMGS